MRTNPLLAISSFLPLVLLSACGTTRAYEGPERPADQVAHIECQSEGSSDPLGGFFQGLTEGVAGYSPEEHLDVYVDRVDEREVGASTLDLLPGSHRLSVSAHDSKLLVHFGGSLAFEAQAGKSYELRITSGQKMSRVFAIREKGAQDWLATSERPPAEFCPIAAADWLAPYEFADAADNGEIVSTTWIPKGQTLENFAELLEATRLPNSGGAAVYPANPAWRERWEEERPRIFRERKALANGKDWMAFSYTGERPPRSGARSGVGVYRVVGEQQYLLCFERLGAELTAADRELWQKRFLEAALR